MLTYTKHALLTLLLLAPLSPLCAQNKDARINPEIDQSIDQLMRVSGLKYTIDSFPQEIRAQIKQQKLSNPRAALTDEESTLLFSQLNSDAIYRNLKQHLNSQLDSEKLTALLEMHNDPLMKRIVAAEIAASSVETQKEMATFIAKLRHKPPSEQRIKMIQQLDRVSMSTESVLYIVEIVMLGMSEMMLGREGKNNDTNRAQMQAEIASTSRLIEDELRQQIIMSMHYIYRDFSDAEVMHYIEQLKRDASQHYTHAAIEGIGIVILDAFKQGMNQLLQRRNARAA